ncbi:MAG: TIM barrel protein [Planctomycetota bacterium]
MGLDRVKAIHLNDSKRGLGTHIDRHEHIGEGCLGPTPFSRLLNDRRFHGTPMYLETPKGESRHHRKSWDTVNLSRLRRLGCS